MTHMEPQHTIYPAVPHTHTIIFLHGRDSTATEFALELFESQATNGKTLPEALPSIKWIFPTAKLRKSSRFGEEVSQWFDIWAVESPQNRLDIQQPGLRESVTQILNIIDEEAKSTPHERIILAGISQGCAIAIHTLFNCDRRLGGFIGLSSWMPYLCQIEHICSDTADEKKRMAAIRAISSSSQAIPFVSGEQSCLRTPVFLGHCKDDQVVSVSDGKLLGECLRKLGMLVKQVYYEDGGHWLNEPNGVDDILGFLDL